MFLKWDPSPLHDPFPKSLYYIQTKENAIQTIPKKKQKKQTDLILPAFHRFCYSLCELIVILIETPNLLQIGTSDVKELSFYFFCENKIPNIQKSKFNVILIINAQICLLRGLGKQRLYVINFESGTIFALFR